MLSTSTWIRSDSVDRAIDADDLARTAKTMGMRGMVMKNHWEDRLQSSIWSGRKFRASSYQEVLPRIWRSVESIWKA